MKDEVFEIGAPGLDVEAVVADVRAAVLEKTRQNLYADARIARAERSNLDNIKDDETFLAFYLECLRDAVFVDINDFEILERRAWGAGLLVELKKLIWKGLKFYTYRLWTQQNQVNGLLLSALDSMENRYRERIADLERRIADLENPS
jgi:hypothetical protein